MEKLQPLLVHRFWVAFGLAIILCLIGWWVDSNSLATEIESRISTIDSANSSASVSGAVPNPKWSEKLAAQNKLQDAEVNAAADFLWNEQKVAMVWPPAIAGMMSDVPYRGEYENSRPLSIYRTRYWEELRRIRQIVEPYDPVTDKGRIQLAEGILPQVPAQQWATNPPRWKELWDAQEDIWLTEALLRSIARLNSQAEGGIRETPVRMIEQLILLGGNRESIGSGDGGEMDGGSDDGDMPAGMGGMGMGGMMSGAGSGSMGSGSGGGGLNLSVDFDPTEELGSAAGSDSSSDDEDSEGLAGGGGDDDGGGMGGMMGSMGMMGGGMMGGGMGSGGGRRYVDDDPTRPFKTRGFYLKVVMQNDMVPELVSELTNSRFPVEILRLHQQDIHQDEVEATGSAGGASGMGMGMGGGRSSSGMGMGMGMGMGGLGSGGPGGLGSPGGPGGLGSPGGPGGLGSPGGVGGGPGVGGLGGTGPGVGGLGGLGGDSGEMGYGSGGAESSSNGSGLQSALEDRNLVRVVICGLLTLYTPPVVAEDDAGNMSSEQGTVDDSPGVPGESESTGETGNAPSTDPADSDDGTAETPTADPESGSETTPPDDPNGDEATTGEESPETSADDQSVNESSETDPPEPSDPKTSSETNQNESR